MKTPIAATAATAAVLVAASMLGVASAEAPTTSSTRTVSVEGVSIVPISQTADAATATAAYRAGLAAAVADGQAKAEFLAGKVGASLGGAQSVVEGGGFISCTGGEEGASSEYQGAQPDFGNPGATVTPLRVSSGVAAPGSTAPAIRKPTVKHRKHRRSPSGKAAATVSCTLSAQVSLAYAIN